MKKILISYWPVFIILFLNILFFSPIINGKIPFPGDTLIGAYYPWRDLKWGGLLTEYPLKNMTISDITGSIYPWRYLAIEQIKSGQWPLWNNFEFSGTPLLANPYTAVFYPLNIFFFLFSFPVAWTILVFLGSSLSGIFFYLFLRNKNLSNPAAFIGSICFSFGSYFLNMSEFNIISHTILWIPLGLLAIDKLAAKKDFRWLIVLIFSLTMSIFAGFIQFAFYGYILIFLYAFFRARNTVLILIISIIFSGLLSSVQLLPFIELLFTSGRINAYGSSALFTNFFIPVKQLLMFFIPDYFGNPSTNNYWGGGNYYEFCGYIGIVSLFFIIIQIFDQKPKKEIYFWFFLTLFALFFSIDNPVSRLPYVWNIPFLSALVPSRLMFFIAFSLPILVSFGLELFIGFRYKIKQIFIAWIVLLFIVFLGISYRDTLHETLILRNSFLPITYLILGLLLFLGYVKLPRFFSKAILFLFCLLLFFDLFRQGRKFLTFFDINLLYPKIETTNFLKQNLGFSRFMPLHQEIFGTNHQTMYSLESIEGFSPYYNQKYGQFISLGQEYAFTDSFTPSLERTVYGRNYQANVFKLLSVKYFLNLNEIKSVNFPLVFQEGRVKIYENIKVIPRIFLTCNHLKIIDQTDTIRRIENLNDPAEMVFTDEDLPIKCRFNEPLGLVKIINYSSGKMLINSNTPDQRLLVTADNYFPGWKVYIDNQKSRIIKVDYVLRGVIVPAGNHEIKFIYDPESFKIGLTISLTTLTVLVGITGWSIRKRK